jgi:hypothetical protein
VLCWLEVPGCKVLEFQDGHLYPTELLSEGKPRATSVKKPGSTLTVKAKQVCEMLFNHEWTRLRRFNVHGWLQVQWRTQEFFFGGFQQIHLRAEGSENVNVWAVDPPSLVFRSICK